MKSTNLFLRRKFHSPILRPTAVALVALIALAWSNPAFRGNIHDAAWADNLGKAKTNVNAKDIVELLSQQTAQPGTQPPTEATPPPSKPPAFAAGAVSKNPKDALVYVWIPPGAFQMGCSPADSECIPWERPSHEVTISKGFWLGQTDVTVEAYERFAKSSGRAMPFVVIHKDNMPIGSVSWDDAHAYCGWVGGRLPTEAEWEYAARGGSADARYGNLDEIAWYSSGFSGWVHEVAQKRANGFGLYDMLGNVAQWVNDWYSQSYYENSPSQDPAGPSSGRAKVVRGRGGAPDGGARGVRVSYRFGVYPAIVSSDIGFRCAEQSAVGWAEKQE